jgi:hypothetical protein
MKKAKDRRKEERRRIAQNIGRLHAVRCEWCGLKMACSCYFDECRDLPRRKHKKGAEQPHPLVMCPRCQVTEFISALFGAKSHEDARPDSKDAQWGCIESWFFLVPRAERNPVESLASVRRRKLKRLEIEPCREAIPRTVRRVWFYVGLNPTVQAIWCNLKTQDACAPECRAHQVLHTILLLSLPAPAQSRRFPLRASATSLPLTRTDRRIQSARRSGLGGLRRDGARRVLRWLIRGQFRHFGACGCVNLVVGGRSVGREITSGIPLAGVVET